uniref:PSI-K n=2 Tax=Galdieria sulphuraria TaxID=130081 RepID=E3UIU8_GALSU|nr:photosystem I reaction center subunit X [Galdieria sulphuraria]ADO32973.1 photosystem I subunit K [Galdieria sulphuraria]AIG92628.1 photosystem I reaction center subunit X [Galdieria sulphuraria]
MLISASTSIIFIVVNTICIILGKYSIQNKKNQVSLIANINLAELLASMSLGHIISSATVIGLKSLNII